MYEFIQSPGAQDEASMYYTPSLFPLGLLAHTSIDELSLYSDHGLREPTLKVLSISLEDQRGKHKESIAAFIVPELLLVPRPFPGFVVNWRH